MIMGGCDHGVCDYGVCDHGWALTVGRLTSLSSVPIHPSPYEFDKLEVFHVLALQLCQKGSCVPSVFPVTVEF